MDIRSPVLVAMLFIFSAGASAAFESNGPEQARRSYAKQVVETLHVPEFTAAFVEGAEAKTLVMNTGFGPKGAPRSPLVEMQAKELGFSSVAYHLPNAILTINLKP